MLDVRKLAALREIATRGSFSAAARELNYSQSAISQQVAQLEREVGALLIERRGRRIRLTPAGQALADRGRPDPPRPQAKPRRSLRPSPGSRAARCACPSSPRPRRRSCRPRLPGSGRVIGVPRSR